MARAKGIKPMAQNKKAFHDYFVEERLECGMELHGTEVKSMRQGRMNLKESFAIVKDGEVLVTTPIVSGATWGYPTPEGLYKVENKDTNCWLSGADYNVHVDYWIGVIGWQIGIHDADWRTIFGGQQYIREGSHGCINTPKEATAMIFENIEVGVPVLVYGK